jgi:hypothetical protein
MSTPKKTQLAIRTGATSAISPIINIVYYTLLSDSYVVSGYVAPQKSANPL